MRQYDVIVIGSGIAGLTFALKCADAGRVAVLTKKAATDSSTNNAQGGIASVFAADDSFEAHVHDTLEAGAGLCHRERVELLVKNGPDAIMELVRFGTQFTGHREEAGRTAFDLGREGGHSRHRIIHAQDLTGREIERALLAAAQQHPAIDIMPGFTCVELLTEHHVLPGSKSENCLGVYAFDNAEKRVELFRARCTMIATGGCGCVYKHTTNPDIATGDGIAIAFRAGAKVANLEFMQFHPTTLYHPKARSFLITEALRGFGAVLVDDNGQDFMQKRHPMGSLAPRDIVARAIDMELKEKGLPCVYLDTTRLPAEELKRKFPFIYATCLEYGINITRDPIPVVPAAHYMCGGIVVDDRSRTTLNRLYACGESAHTGVHGANRLASNSLLEAVVFAKRAAGDAKALLKEVPGPSPALPEWDETGTLDPKLVIELVHDKSEIQTLMWDFVGIMRSDQLLQRAMRRLEAIRTEVEDYYKRTRISEPLLEVRNLAQMAMLIVRCALLRHESRGLNFNIDYPERDDRNFLKDTVL
ncbi:MAG: L-aspartate oxidase [Fibrobacterota bacterium]